MLAPSNRVSPCPHLLLHPHHETVARGQRPCLRAAAFAADGPLYQVRDGKGDERKRRRQHELAAAAGLERSRTATRGEGDVAITVARELEGTPACQAQPCTTEG